MERECREKRTCAAAAASWGRERRARKVWERRSSRGWRRRKVARCAKAGYSRSGVARTQPKSSVSERSLEIASTAWISTSPTNDNSSTTDPVAQYVAQRRRAVQLIFTPSFARSHSLAQANQPQWVTQRSRHRSGGSSRSAVSSSSLRAPMRASSPPSSRSSTTSAYVERPFCRPRGFRRGILEQNTHNPPRSSSMVPLPTPRRSSLATPLLFPTSP